MKALLHLDARIRDRLFQPLVDRFQRPPAWFAEQCGWAYAVAAIVDAAIRGVDDWSSRALLLVSLAVALLLYGAARAPVLLARLAGLWWLRLMLAAFVLVQGIGCALQPLTAGRLASLCIYGAAACFYYFAACRPPRPKAPRRVRAVSRSAAR